VNEWIGLIGITVAVLVPAVGGAFALIIKLTGRMATNETNIENIKELLKRQATQEGLNSLDRKIDLFYSLVKDTADLLVAKHADQVTEYRKSLISANHTMDRLEKQLKETEQENDSLRKQR